MGELILLRHGETEWSLDGQHTGRTDLPLTARGEAAAKALEPMLSRRDIVAVFTSPARRAVTNAARQSSRAGPYAPRASRTRPRARCARPTSSGSSANSAATSGWRAR